MRALVSILVGLAVFAGCAGAWWVYWPLWQIESRVKTKLPEAKTANFSSVTYNRATRSGCGYVDAQVGAGAPAGSPTGKRHFILMPDGKLEFDPDDRLRGSSLQQLQALQKHANYLSLVYTHCAAG